MMENKWPVYSPCTDEGYDPVFKVFDTEEKALSCAEQLAKKSPGRVFYILRPARQCVMSAPVVWSEVK